jgi:hypothetical protein
MSEIPQKEKTLLWLKDLAFPILIGVIGFFLWNFYTQMETQTVLIQQVKEQAIENQGKFEGKFELLNYRLEQLENKFSNLKQK